MRQEHADRHGGHAQRPTGTGQEDLLSGADRQGRRETFQGLRAAAGQKQAGPDSLPSAPVERRHGATVHQRKFHLPTGRDQGGRPWHADGQVHHRRGVQPGRRDRQDDPGRHGPDHEHATAFHGRATADLDHLDRGHGRLDLPQRPVGRTARGRRAATHLLVRFRHPGRRRPRGPPDDSEMASGRGPAVGPGPAARLPRTVRGQSGRLGARVRQPARHGRGRPRHRRDPVAVDRGHAHRTRPVGGPSCSPPPWT